MGNAMVQPCASGVNTNDVSYIISKCNDNNQDVQSCARLHQSSIESQGKVVIRPIAFKPVVPQGASSQGLLLKGAGSDAAPYNGIPPSSFSATIQTGRPDTRYTSTPTLSRGQIQHYGSMGDLKCVGHSNSSYSLDRRGGVALPAVSAQNYYDPYHDNKHNNNSNTVLNNNIHSTIAHNSSNSSSSSGVGHRSGLSGRTSSASGSSVGTFTPKYGNYAKGPPTSSPDSGTATGGESSPPSAVPSYPQPPPRLPTTSCVNGPYNLHRRFPSVENRLSDPAANGEAPTSAFKYHPSTSTSTSTASGTAATDIPRYESLRNLTGEPGSSANSANPSRLHHATQRMGGSVSNLSRLPQPQHHHSSAMSGSSLGLDRSLSVTGSALGLDGRSLRSSLSELRLDPQQQKQAQQPSEDVRHGTPSPSDSGVAELEAMLREKDSEIMSLRETMEQNETVIFKVYEEKEKTWERELKKIRDLYDSRLKAAQQKALKVEQSLSTQTYQLQQERRKMAAELEEVRGQRDGGVKQVEQLKKEVASLRAALEETEWSLCQKSGEISLLKTQLKDSQGDQTTRGHELLHLRAQVRQYQSEVERRRAEAVSLHELTTQLRRELTDARTHAEATQRAAARNEGESSATATAAAAATFEEERSRWAAEKERVLQFQKQLNRNYMSVLGRNRRLEEEVAALTGVPMLPQPHLIPPPSASPLTDSTMPSPNYPKNNNRDLAAPGKSESRC